MSAAPSGDLINLQLGWPSPRLCERAGLLEGAQAALAESANMAPILLYGPHQGYAPLRETISKWLYDIYLPTAGNIGPDRICITGGASQNLANITMKFADPGYTRRIFMVEPTYFLACPVFEDCGFQGKLHGVPEGPSDGIDLDFLRQALEMAELEAKRASFETGLPDVRTMKTGPKYPHIYKYLIYLNPTYSNPSGKTMSLGLRKRLVQLARIHDALLITDDVYDFLSWPENATGLNNEVARAPPRLVDIDRDMEGCTEFGNAVSNGSFSKLIGPGVRVGWTESTPAFANQLANVGSSNSGGAPSHLASTLVSHMLQTGRLQDFIRTVLVPTYRKRYHTLMNAIETKLIPLGFKNESTTTISPANTPRTAGGYFTYLRLPPDLPVAKTVAAIALRDYSLRVAFGHMFTVAGDTESLARAEAKGGFAGCIRLCWAWHEEAELAEGIRRLEAAVVSIRERMARGEDVGAGVEIGIR